MSKKRRKTSGKIRKPSKQYLTSDIKNAIKAGNYDRAIITLNTAEARKLIPEQKRQTVLAEVYFRRAMRYRDRYPDDALLDLDKAINLCPDDPLYVYHNGMIHHHQQDFTKAIDRYRKALSLDPAFERAMLPLLLARRVNGVPVADLKTDAAWATLTDEQRSLLTGSADAIQGLPAALVAMREQNIDTAYTQFTEVIEDKAITNAHKAIAYDYLGRIAAGRDDQQQALSHWRKAYELGRRDPVLLENLVLFYVLELEAQITAGNYTDAHKLLGQVTAYDLYHPRLPAIKGHIMLKLGYDAALKGHWSTALDHWQGVQTDGNTARAAAANLGLAYEETGDYGLAADAWRDFVKRRSKKPGNPDYLIPEQVGRLWSRVSQLYMQDDQLDEAVNTLQTALKHDPDNVEMNLQLARRLAEADRTEAAHNQVEHVLKMAPDYIEALVLRAELWEVAPRRGYYNWGGVFGIEQWKDVLNAGDESYAGLARQRLQELYYLQLNHQMRFFAQKAQESAEDILVQFPDFHDIRALYIHILYALDASKTTIWQQVDLLDLTNEDALHQVIDTVHIHEADEDAEVILQKAEAQQALSDDFYIGVAHCAIDRKQIDIAENYYQQALQRTKDDDSYNAVRVDQAQKYYSQRMYDEATMILKAVLEKDSSFGPAHIGMAIIVHSVENNNRKAKRHLRKARSWAKKHNDTFALEQIEDLMFQIDNPMPPMGDLLSGLDPNMVPPEMRRMLENMSPDELAALLGGMMDDFDTDDFS